MFPQVDELMRDREKREYRLTMRKAEEKILSDSCFLLKELDGLWDAVRATMTLSARRIRQHDQDHPYACWLGNIFPGAFFVSMISDEMVDIRRRWPEYLRKAKVNQREWDRLDPNTMWESGLEHGSINQNSQPEDLPVETIEEARQALFELQKAIAEDARELINPTIQLYEASQKALAKTEEFIKQFQAEHPEQKYRLGTRGFAKITLNLSRVLLNFVSHTHPELFEQSDLNRMKVLGGL